ncbi:MAG: hypothetical protein HXY25_05685 [Alphaproteobacteria bacterium]|nr:hypothetical protein [Alphaproteobacteria bacterium]
MTLAELSDLSQALGAVAVVASLIFVGIQIRQNTAATRAASHNAVSASLNEINRMFAESAELSKIWLAGMADRDALTAEERWRFDATARAYMHVCETMYIQAGLGVGDKGILRAEEDGLRRVLAAPGFRAWWTENPFGFCAEFRGYVADLAPAAEATH